MKATVERVGSCIDDFPVDALELCSVGIVTDAPEHSSIEIGEPVIRINDELYYMKSDNWGTVKEDVDEGYRVRTLLDDEKIVIQNN